MLHLHHVNAPSFCGEDEVMNGIEERVHTCVSVTANTTVAMLPARVFQVLITSQFPARMYKSAEKLRRLREARTDWYDIRMSLGDSAAVPFGFLDHSQSKLLPNEIHEGVVTRERKITNLFQRVLRCVWVRSVRSWAHAAPRASSLRLLVTIAVARMVRWPLPGAQPGACKLGLAGLAGLEPGRLAASAAARRRQPPADLFRPAAPACRPCSWGRPLRLRPSPRLRVACPARRLHRSCRYVGGCGCVVAWLRLWLRLRLRLWLWLWLWLWLCGCAVRLVFALRVVRCSTVRVPDACGVTGRTGHEMMTRQS